jgi:serine/threonine protein kinase
MADVREMRIFEADQI